MKSVFLLDVVRPIRGTEPGSHSYCEPKDGVRFLRVGDISGKVDSPKFTNSSKNVLVNKNDILLVLDGSPGYVARGFEGAISSGIRKMEIVSTDLNLQFLYYALHSSDIQDVIKKHTRGVTIAHASSALPHIKIPLPSIADQERIVHMLDEVEALRITRNSANERMEQFVLALFYEIFGNPLQNPKKFEVVKFQELINFITSGSRGWAKYYSPNGKVFIRVQNLSGNKLNLSDIAFVNPPNTVEAKRARVSPNDILLAITGNTIGLTAVAPIDLDEAYVSQHVAIIRLNNLVDPVYIYALLTNQDGGQFQIKGNQYGHTKPGISLEQIKNFDIMLPPLALQREFAAWVEEARGVQSAQARSTEKIEALYQSMLSRAFKGEL